MNGTNHTNYFNTINLFELSFNTLKIFYPNPKFTKKLAKRFTFKPYENAQRPMKGKPHIVWLWKRLFQAFLLSQPKATVTSQTTEASKPTNQRLLMSWHARRARNALERRFSSHTMCGLPFTTNLSLPIQKVGLVNWFCFKRSA